MVVRKEYRIPLPISLDEYNRAQIYTSIISERDFSKNGEGIERVETIEEEEQTYVKRLYHVHSLMPSPIQKVIKKDQSVLIEQGWLSYPLFKTTFTNTYMGENFLIEITTIHKDDLGESENIHDLSDDEWKNTEVVNIDIAENGPEEWDPKKIDLRKFGKANIEKGWIEKLKNEAHMEAWARFTERSEAKNAKRCFVSKFHVVLFLM
ncbi:unnamed protein product [Oikopleura dioica]|uniref:Phosphatidylinositol transfer protein N-terminal domain-containing protein n=1 Tax=Oikopleura dioica TaxID=34765 RepID=E4WWB0_OIKDI|nr:unnamed protein product [Oikopleura dioica]